jgi:hypothetical protein
MQNRPESPEIFECLVNLRLLVGNACNLYLAAGASAGISMAARGPTPDEALANLREALDRYFEDEPASGARADRGSRRGQAVGVSPRHPLVVAAGDSSRSGGEDKFEVIGTRETPLQDDDTNGPLGAAGT